MGAPGRAAAQPEALILRAAQARDLIDQALADVVEPVGGLLGRISPSSSFATANHGLGYSAVSLGATGLRFEITDPDYTEVDASGTPASIEGGAGAVFMDVEIGLFEGYGRTGRAKNMGAVDLLLRFGATVGDQENLAEKVDLQSWSPIFGAGFRVGILRGERLPSVSLSGGLNHFTERRFSVIGDVDGDPFEVDLDLRQSTIFLLAEVGKQWRGVLPFAGVGVVWHDLDAEFRGEVLQGDEFARLADQVNHKATGANLFGGLELGSSFLRLVLEAGVSSGQPYGTVSFKIIPFPGY